MRKEDGCWFCNGEVRNFDDGIYEVSRSKNEMYVEDIYTYEAGVAAIEIKFCPFCGKELEK